MSPENEAYFESLREWKQTPDLPQTFVWFDSWSGASNTGSESLRALPDSVTIASNWGAHGADTSKFDLSPARKYDMEVMQKTKGTKVVVTYFSRFPGEGLPKSRFPHWYKEGTDEYNYVETTAYSSDEELVRPYIRRYAEDLYKACIETGYDGWDWDFEPGFGMGSGLQAPFWDNAVQLKIFVEEMSYWFGPYAMDPDRDRGDRPMPEKRLLMIIDGAIGFSRMLGMPVKYFDYFILQAYSGNNLSGRVQNAIREIKSIDSEAFTEDELVKKIILTENFESYASSGGGFLNMSKYVHRGTENGKVYEQQIGGCGLYRVGFDYVGGKWRYLDQGITNMYRIWRERQEDNN
ncbi:MAG: endoglycosidase [Bacteroidales bacterium]|nr:endoglycosidase [Bacteroidales bacterium]